MRTAPRFFQGLPLAAWVAALVIAALHMLPMARAKLVAPDGYTVTGNVSSSPDLMQYRVWMRQAAAEGPVVSNRFTTEPNRPYLPVPFYYVIGKVSQATGVTPEWVYVWTGAVLAMLLSLLVFATARYFLSERTALWTAFLSIMIGGGVGGYIVTLERSSIAHDFTIVQRLFTEPLAQPMVEVLDELRGDYVVNSLADTHFLLIWLFATVAILAFYRAIRSFSWTAVGLAAVSFAGATVVHVYEGVTLLAVAFSVAALCWVRRIKRFEVSAVTAACTIAVIAVFAWIGLLVGRSGLPVPPWRGPPIYPLLLFLGFPLAWVLVFWGLARYWREGGLERCFLLGWIIGCTVLTLSAPFYPWPNRGVLSLQIPLTIVAAAVWFNGQRKLDARAIAVCILLMGSTPVVKVMDRWKSSGFSETQPQKFLSPDDRATIAALNTAARTNDVLLADFDDRLWLAPDYRGRHYAGHFFLTVDYDRKHAETVDLLKSDASRAAEFLTKNQIRFFYVAKRRDPSKFRTVPGLVPLHETADGVLFEYLPARTRGQS
ncbi:MAG TPA: hypothetical protein VGC44_10475 [Longimicrobiales bacterium]